MHKAKDIWEQLNLLDEITKIEAKHCVDNIDRSVMETICAFANEPGLGGGEIILGIEAKKLENDAQTKEYVITGVTDTDKIQNDIATKCASMFNQALRPSIEVEQIEGKNTIIIGVNELDPRAKPLYFKSEGLPRGAYRRIGATDQRCTEDDMPVFYASADSYDSTIIEETTFEDIDETALKRYRDLRAVVNAQAEELTYNDRDLLISLGACKKGKDGQYHLTYTGLLVFGKSIAQRRLLPAVRVDYIRVSGTEWMQDVDKRFDTIDMRGPLILLVNRAYNAIIDDLPRGFVLQDGHLQAKTSIGLPEKTLREAIVNSYIHRSYKVNQPIQIIRYSNRIEIINPGFSLKPEESLGEPGSVLRNPFISAIFHETNLAETKGSGITAMRKMMKAAGMLPPTFESDHTRNQFTIRLLLHHFLCEEDIRWLSEFTEYHLNDNQKLALIFTREVGAIDNITYRQMVNLKQFLASKDLKMMCDQSLLAMKGQGKTTYYVAGQKLLERIAKGTDPNIEVSDLQASKVPTPNAKSTDLQASKVPTSNAKGTDLQASKVPTPNAKGTDLFPSLPLELRERLAKLGRKESKKDIFYLVECLCDIMPLSVSEIAALIHRNENYTKRKIVQPLREANRIQYTIPEMIHHPEQKYKKVK